MKSRVIMMACVVAGALSVSGCKSMLVRPAADNVKTVALVSVSMNRDFYDVVVPRPGSVDLKSLKPLAQALIKGTKVPDRIDDPNNGKYEQIVAHGIAAYSGKLEGIGGWKWLPSAGVLSSDAYRVFAASYTGKAPSFGLVQASKTLNEAEWYTARDMVRIPLDRITKSGTKTIVIGDSKESQANACPALAQLCKDLGVDAVAVLQFDMAYKKTLIGLDFVGGLPAVPSVRSALVLVNKDGDIVLNSGPIAKGPGKRFDGKTVKMLSRDQVQLTDKSIDSYCLALDRSAEDMQKRLEKEFSKK